MPLQRIAARPAAAAADAGLAQAPFGPGGWRAALWDLVRQGLAEGARVETRQGRDLWDAAAAGVTSTAGQREFALCADDEGAEHRLILHGPRPAAARRAQALALAFAAGCRAQLAVEQAALSVAADHLGQAHMQAVFCHPDGRTVYATEALETPELRIDASGLRAVAPEDQAGLRQALRRAAFGGESSQLVLGRAAERPVVAQVRPALPALQPLRALAVVIVHRRAGQAQARTRLLRQLFGLTEAEALVAAAIGDGARVEQIAEARRVAASTVRAQIKTILAKVGVGRQVELVQRLTELA